MNYNNRNIILLLCNNSLVIEHIMNNIWMIVYWNNSMMCLNWSACSCELSHTLKCEEIHYRSLTLAKRGSFWKTLVNVTSKVKSNKALKLKIKPNCVT